MDVKDSCCLLTLPMIPPYRSQKTSAFVQGLDVFCLRTLFQWYQHIKWGLGLHTGSRLDCVNLTIQQKPTSAGMNVLREAFRDMTFPCAHNYVTCGGTDWFKNYKIRCRTTSDVKDRLSSPACWSKTNKKRVSNIKHFQMLKLMFYLKITMLILSLLLLLFVCLLHNEKPSFLSPLWTPGFPLLMNMVFVDTMSVSHASWQTDTLLYELQYVRYE